MKLDRPLGALVASLILLTVVAQAPSAQACTAFFVDTPQGPVVAKSFDWRTDRGYLVANERGRVRTKLVPGGAPDVATWTATHASLTFTTVGPGFPSSGMNDAGLAIEALVDTGVAPSRTPDPDRLTGLELVQYGLDRFATAEAFAAFAERAGVAQLAIPLHFFACDAQRACVVVESRSQASGAGVAVTRGGALTVPVLANGPWRVDHQLSNANPSFLTRLFGGAGPARGTSPARFATIATGLGGVKPRNEGQAMELLTHVASGGTAWQIVWNVATKTALWREPRRGHDVSSMKLEEVDTTCHGAPRVRAIGGAEGDGDAFTAWGDGNAASAARAVVEQVGVDTPATRVLGRAVAAATQASRCETSP